MQEEAELQSKSHMCPGSIRLMGGYERGNVHDRLHDLSKQQILKQKAAEIYLNNDPEATYKP